MNNAVGEQCAWTMIFLINFLGAVLSSFRDLNLLPRISLGFKPHKNFIENSHFHATWIASPFTCTYTVYACIFPFEATQSPLESGEHSHLTLEDNK